MLSSRFYSTSRCSSRISIEESRTGSSVRATWRGPGQRRRRRISRLAGSCEELAVWGARRRMVPCRAHHGISRSPQFGGDQVRHDGWRPGDVEASNALLDGPITNGDALMLAQVLEPGLD